MIILKNGQIAFVSIFVVLVISAILLANLLIPQVKTVTTASTYTDSLARTNVSINESFTLTHRNVQSLIRVSNGSINLTSSNYTITNGFITLLNNNVPVATYTATYTAFYNSFSLSAGEIALFSVVILAGLIGLLYFAFKSFGLSD